MCLAMAQHQRKTHQEREEFHDVAHLIDLLASSSAQQTTCCQTHQKSTVAWAGSPFTPLRGGSFDDKIKKNGEV
jgi:hypothetical protein